jgi:hypothetical protein
LGGGEELGHAVVVLYPRLALDAARDVDGRRPADRDRFGHVLRLQPAGEDRRDLGPARAEQLPVEALAGASGGSGAVRVEEMKVGAERLGAGDVGGASDPDRLDHLAARAPRGLAAERRALVPVKLQHRERLVLGRRDHVIEARVDEHADDLHLTAKLGADLRRDGGVHAAGARVVVDQPDRPRAEARGLAGVLRPRDAAELDSHPAERSRGTRAGRVGGVRAWRSLGGRRA